MPKKKSVSKVSARLVRKLASGETPPMETRRARGVRLVEEIVGRQGVAILDGLADIAPDLTRDIVDHAYGDVIGAVGLDDRTRALVVVAALAALGTAQPQLRVHIGSALNSGCTRKEILDTIRLTGVYAGFPAALNGVVAAREAFEAADR